ncbi:ejaculatory bulb-specific protein 3 isoform X1 [Neodiprion lecontei]|uniref:Ejaculatory bulb-specific protein 3 isoform X1 n=1 Tax=Neodiprion lecontei TaxID=441921 RepID=A0ABM3GPR8_NEOLC|nr:ejaculatory bulb-specific protein 3 isoform X1 [Neodiprion lecontei]
MLVILALLYIGGVLAAESDKYTTKYDNVDVEAVIRNERLTKNYVGCLLDLTPCTPDGSELKTSSHVSENLPDALATNCAGCSTAQKNAADKFSQHLIDQKPEDWKLLEAKYDPTGAYRLHYLEEQSKNSTEAER